ncbi:MAG TPA: hypothetical protein VHV55_08090 [Pirellulales bacterium]|jgi:hypothetical protein|nr:hypothetical protein [Pirellulales bacterium]
MQYYMELKPPIQDVYFESSAFPDASEQLEAIAKRLRLPSHFELFSYAAQNDLSPPEHKETEVPWFDARLGIDWIEAIIGYVSAEPASVPNADALLTDLIQCADILRRAEAEGSKWHFEMDI